MRYRSILLAIPAIFSAGIAQSQSSYNVTVHPTVVLNDTVRNPIGINTDWLLDNQSQRTVNPAYPDTPIPSLASAFGSKGLNVKYLRYPGGEETNEYLWSVSPWTTPDPSPSLPGLLPQSVFTNAYDFTQFMNDCKAIQCEPSLVVTQRPYLYTGTAYVPPTRQDLIDTAAAWVAYAKRKGFGGKHWEIGNEFNVAGNPTRLKLPTAIRP